jgi:hypothetical protein
VLAAYAMLRDPDRRADHDRSTARSRRVDIPVTHRATPASTDPNSTAPIARANTSCAPREMYNGAWLILLAGRFLETDRHTWCPRRLGGQGNPGSP